MKIFFLINLCIIACLINNDLSAQLLRIDCYGTVKKEKATPEKEMFLNDAHVARQQVGIVESTKTNPSVATLKRKVFHPPLKRIIPTSQFGMRVHPVSGARKMHTGIDLKAWYEQVYSIADGIVKHEGWRNKEGYYIIINHGEVESVYCHLSEIVAAKGSIIKAGEVIGISGNTGSSTGPHLHFGVKWRYVRINPNKVLKLMNNN